MWNGRSGQEESTVDVGLHRPVELLGGNVGNAFNGVHDRSVVDENVNSSPGFNDSLDDSVTALLVSDILGDEKAFPTGGIDELLGLVGVDLFFGQVDNGNVGTLHAEHDGGGTSDTRVTSSNNGLLANELFISPLFL